MTGHRDYSPGDDFHAIDWTLCARRNELYVKLFEGQSDRDVHLLVDCSPSMGLGRPAKFHLARQIAAALGYVSLMNLDRLVVAAFADGLAADLPPLRHASRVLRLLRFLEELSPLGAKTDLLRAVEMFVRRPQRQGPVVVISDLYDPGRLSSAAASICCGSTATIRDWYTWSIPAMPGPRCWATWNLSTLNRRPARASRSPSGPCGGTGPCWPNFTSRSATIAGGRASSTCRLTCDMAEERGLSPRARLPPRR